MRKLLGPNPRRVSLLAVALLAAASRTLRSSGTSALRIANPATPLDSASRTCWRAWAG